MHDLRFALRQFASSPGSTTIVVPTLALGIGANTAIFCLVNTTFLRALPYPGSDQLVHLAEQSATGNSCPVSYPNFLDWQRQQEVFSGLAAIAACLPPARRAARVEPAVALRAE